MKKLIKYEVVALLLVFGFITSCNKAETDTNTLSNLKASLVSEYYTSSRYNAFAEKAEKEGYFQIAKLFKALSVAESVHARNFKQVLDLAGVKTEKHVPAYLVESTEKNLKSAIEEEVMDIDSIYPSYELQSIGSDIRQANDVFNYVWQAEKTHKDLLMLIYDVLMTSEIKENGVAVSSAPSKESLSQIEDMFSKTNYYVCPMDGRVFDTSNIADKCNFCLTSRSKFIVIH
jgi:rubrerythrin